ncbi:MAG: sugar transferase [Longimicrobiales bacterium]
MTVATSPRISRPSERVVPKRERPAQTPAIQPDAAHDVSQLTETPCEQQRYTTFKRIMDVPLAAVLLVIAAPIMAVIALMIRLNSPGPVLFRQKRLGRHGVAFPCLKFRTMRIDAEKILMSDPDLFEHYQRNGYKLPDGEDPRLIPFGGFLRKTSLDELPQLLNVLRGEMSLVGPRPIVPAELDEYGDDAEAFLSAFPGITGYWQVNGRSHLGYPQRAAVELEYIEMWTPSLDLLLLLKTVPVVLARRGAH